jgi:hypothetical protein
MALHAQITDSITDMVDRAFSVHFADSTRLKRTPPSGRIDLLVIIGPAWAAAIFRTPR